MANYKFKFNEYQITQFQKFTGTDSCKNKIQSIYAYIIKYPELSSKDLFNKYMYKTSKEDRFTRKSWNDCIKKLVDLDLLETSKKGLKTFYTVIYNGVEYGSKVSVEDGAELKVSESVENTSLETTEENPNSKKLNKDLYHTILDNIFGDLNIKSKTVYNTVLNKLQSIELDVNGAVSYITKMVINAYKEFQEYRNAIAKLRANRKKESFTNTVGSTYSDVNSDIRAAKNQNFCMMSQRDRDNEESGYMNWNDLENSLLGWN